MLRHIPFYASLLGQPLHKGKKSTASHVLVYGSIEAHSMGPKGCIAGNKKIADEVGLSEGRTANIISDLSQAGWIRVTMASSTKRALIEPLMVLHVDVKLNTDVKAASQESEALLHPGVNRDYRREHIENTDTAHAVGEPPKSVNVSKPDSPRPDPSTTALVATDESKPVQYGNSEINAIFDYWEQTVGYKLVSQRQKNRNACSNLIKTHGIDGLQRLIQGVAKANLDKYAPRISDFTQLQAKCNDLIAWGRRTVNTASPSEIY